MTPLRKCRCFSAIVAGIVALAWLGASNHCALAAIESAKKTEHACCHDTDKGQPKAPNSTECCEAFNVPLPEHAAAPASHLLVLAPAWFGSAAAWMAVREDVGRAARANAPPDSRGFFEIVLTRCVPSHAPPVVVA